MTDTHRTLDFKRDILVVTPARRFGRVRWGAVARHAYLIVLSLWVLLPLMWLVLASIKSIPDGTQRRIWPKAFLDPLWARYTWLWQAFTLDNPFYRSYWNSIVVTSATVVLSTVCAVLAAYALTLLETPARRIIAGLIIASLFFPTKVTALVGIFMLHHDLGLIGKTWSLIFPYTALTLALSIFFMCGAFRLVSREMLDAATIDGAGSLRILVGIILPMVWGAIVVVAVLTFSLAWGEFVLAGTLVNDQDQWTLAVLMGRGAGGPGFAALFVVALLPALLILVFAQNRLFQALQEGALKG